jgi:hypothetical protein
MKKGLIGCLVVGLLLIVVGGGAAYWFVLRPMWNAGSAIVNNAKDLASAAQVEDSVNNKSPFTAPADGKLTPAQVQSLVAVLTAMQSAMGADFDVLKAKYDAIEAEQKAKGQNGNLQQAMGAYADFSGLLLKATKAQAAALNQQNMSLDEYHWIRGQAYSAIPFLEMDDAALAAFSGTPAAAATAAAPAEETAAAEEAPASSTTAAGGNAAQDKATTEMASAAAKMASAAADMAKAAASAQKAMNDSPEVQAAKANALLLKPYKDLIEKSAGTTWMGF